MVASVGWLYKVYGQLNFSHQQYMTVHADNGIGAFQDGEALCACAKCSCIHDNIGSESQHQHH